MLYRLFRCVANHTLYGNIFRQLDDALRSSTRVVWKEMYNTNMEEIEHDTEHGDTELVPKRGATSVAWTWFGYEKSDTDQKTVLCKICRRPVPTKGSNTTNLFYHLRKNHVKQYGESLRMRPQKVQSSAQNKPPTQTLQEAFACGTPYGKKSRRWKELTAAVATYICKDMAPMYTVEKRGFRELVLTLDPRQDPNTSEVAMAEDGVEEQFEFQYGLEGPTFKNENGECSKSHLSIIKVEQLEPLLPDQNNSSCGSGSPGDSGPPGSSDFGSSMSPAAQFFRKCHRAGCTQFIFAEFASRLNTITERISSQQASEEDFNLTLKVLEASGMLPEIFAKRDQEMEKRLKELQRETEAVRTARSAMRDAYIMSFTPS